MGKILIAANIANLGDLFRVDRGRIDPGEVRQVEIPDAVVDTEATHLSLPLRLIRELGLLSLRPRNLRTDQGLRTVQVYGAVRLSIMGRDWICDVIASPDDGPAVIGRIALHALDFVVDPINHVVIGNPAHDGEWISEFYLSDSPSDVAVRAS